MSEIKFSDNYNDLSDNSGFQFEFYCEHCGDAWRTEVTRYLPGTASGALQTASSILGGIFGNAGEVADYVRDAGYKPAHDRAFATSIEQAKSHFQRCRKCNNYVCVQCYNSQLKLCASCAPSIEDEANAAAHETELEEARTKAQESVKQGKRTSSRVLTCPACGARVAPARFCSECGQPLETKLICKSCQAEITASSKFCPECGARQ